MMCILAQVSILNTILEMLIVTWIGPGNSKFQQSYDNLFGFVTIISSPQMHADIVATWQLCQDAPVAHHLWRTSFTFYVNVLIQNSYGFIWEWTLPNFFPSNICHCLDSWYDLWCCLSSFRCRFVAIVMLEKQCDIWRSILANTWGGEENIPFTRRLHYLLQHNDLNVSSSRLLTHLDFASWRNF